MEESPRRKCFSRKAAYVAFALLPTAVIFVFFLRKILAMKRFVFGDDFQMLKWFHEGRIALPVWEIVKDRVRDGRFYPVYYQNFNLVSLLNSDLSLNNLAERCFYVQAGMWFLTCLVFLLLMTCIAKKAKSDISPAVLLFIPLSMLTVLCTPAFVSYFLTLVLAETNLCVFFPLFFLFYFLACKKEKTVWYVLAWMTAAIAIFCKENVFLFSAVICGVQLLFGWKDLSRKHRIFLFSLPVTTGIFLLLYYFIVYRNMIKAYNTSRLWDQSMIAHIGEIFCSYPVWIFAFLLGILRLVRVVFYRERKHLFMDSMLFAILGFFLSYLVLRLTDWWYWGVGIAVVMPVFFYWLIISGKWWQRAAIFFIPVLCLAVNIIPTCKCVKQSLLVQKQDPLFLKKVDGIKGGQRILFPAFAEGSQAKIEDACYQYLGTFLEKLGTPGKWEVRFIPFRDFPESLTPEEVCVVWQGAVRPPDFQHRLQMSGFQSIASCYFYEAFAYDPDLDAIWKGLPSPDSPVPARSPFCLFDSGWAAQEEWGRWVNGEKAEVSLAVPPRFRKKALKLTFEIYTFVHPKKPVCKFRVLNSGRILKEMSSEKFSNRFSVTVPAESTGGIRLPLTFENIDPCSPKGLGLSADPRRLGVGIRSIVFEEIF